MNRLPARLPFLLAAALGVLTPSLTLGSPGAAPAVATALPFHPHFPKTVECKVSKDLTITVRYQTVTFDRNGAEAMKPGAAWHLAGAEFETSGDLVVGGRKVAAGRYALNARKAEAGWELVLHTGKRFSTRFGDDAHVLATTLDAKAPLFEHLCIDVQPSGDKKNTTLHLEVRFDQLLARTLIELPQ
jgi:Protein of unknown function (DUF2911)